MMFRAKDATYFHDYVPPGLCSAEGDPDPAAAGGADPAAPGGDPVAPPAPAGIDLGDGGEPLPGAGTWPEDWRTRFTGEDADAKEVAMAKRFADPKGVWKKLMNQEKLIASGAHRTAALPEDATSEEVTAYRKAAGIPDKADGYGLAFPADTKPSEADNATLTAYQEHMHSKHITPAAAKEAWNFYLTSTQAAQAARAEAAAELIEQNHFELRKAYPGNELKRNVALTREFLGQYFESPDEIAVLNEVLDTPLKSGAPAKMSPPFMRGLFAMVRSLSPPDRVVGGDGAGGGKSIDDEYNELISKSVNGKITAAEDARINQLKAAQLDRDARGRRAA